MEMILKLKFFVSYSPRSYPSAKKNFTHGFHSYDLDLNELHHQIFPAHNLDLDFEPYIPNWPTESCEGQIGKR
jgi:hypothetical protein